jgi:quercetin dioxygenase-like cupin family protein
VLQIGVALVGLSRWRAWQCLLQQLGAYHWHDQPTTPHSGTIREEAEMGSAPTSGDRVGEVLVRGPGDGPATWAMGSLFERLVSAAETAGALGLSLVTQPPGIATPLHIHTREAEAFFLLDGTMTYQAGSTLYRLSAGYFIYLPMGVPHAFASLEPHRSDSLASPFRQD